MIAASIILLTAGCSKQLSLNNITTLPTHWSNVAGQGDSRAGQFESTKLTMVIHYDIGRLAGHYAAAKPHPNRQWIKRGKLHGSTFRYLLDDDDTLYVTFADEGPANFWTKVKNQSEIDYVLELLARYRKQLLGEEKSGRGRQHPHSRSLPK